MSNRGPFSRLAALSFTSLVSSALALPQHYATTPVGSTNNTLNATIPSIEFSACPEELELPSSLECATLSVPINWDEPTGDHFDLGIVRLPAPSNSTTKVGSLFINPGGPGGSASNTVAGLMSRGLPNDLYNAFDIIGVDPRGVGLSNAVKCNMSIYAERVSLFPSTSEDYDKLVDKNRRLGESCRELTGPVFEYLDTISTAKDHEAVRIALGDEPINFLGLSYGTQLGAQYAQLFPDNIRTLVLDGLLQHSEASSSNILIESSAYSLALGHFFKWASTNESSPFKDQDISSLWYDLIANATETPIPASECNGTACAAEVNGEDILFSAQGYLTRTRNWPTLAQALFNATEGDASSLSPRFDDPSAIAFLGIGCLDWAYEGNLTLVGIKTMKHMADTYTPLTQGASQSWQLQHQCVGWPYPVKNPPKKLSVETETTVLMVNSDGDPSTGYPWAVGMQEQVKNRAFVTRKGDGHTSTLTGGETTQVVFEYLITGKAPEDGLFLDS